MSDELPQAENAEQESLLDASEITGTRERTPTVLLLDTSGSMKEEAETPQGERKPKITQLNEGLQTFKTEVSSKEHAEKRVDISVVTFGSEVNTVQEFTPFQNWEPRQLEAVGNTPMGEAIMEGIELIDQRKEAYRQDGIPYNRPLVWLLTDGVPTDFDNGDTKWSRIQNHLENEKEFEFFAMGVGEADMQFLNELVAPTGRPALKIKEGMFKEYFQFLSNSIEQVSDPASGDEVQLDEKQLAKFTQVDI